MTFTERLKINPEPHYHDPGEHAINRDFDTYKSMVFIDESSDWMTTRPEDMRPDNPMQWSLRHYHTLTHFVPKKLDNHIQPHQDPLIQFEWDWKEEKIFGGLNNFFSKNAHVLDLGSGNGIAVDDINERFKEQGITCIGLDKRYATEKPTNANLVPGNFESLPFKDNSFDRILSVESFPCWIPNEEQTIDLYIDEITRISKKNTIWRGTLPKYHEHDTIKFPIDIIIKKFVEHGWEVVIGHDSFSAKLVLKN